MAETKYSALRRYDEKLPERIELNILTFALVLWISFFLTHGIVVI
jgi:hypothetical protein